MKILLAGGGSGGPVSPVLAVALEIRKSHPEAKFLFVGTKSGPERAMVEAVGIKFNYITAAKLRRYFSFKNLLSPFQYVIGFMQSIRIVSHFKPDVMFSAGGYVAVPVAWAAKFFGTKIVIHQQDARVGLANKLIVPIANEITTAFEFTAKQFYSGSGIGTDKLTPAAKWVGNPVRPELSLSSIDAKKYFGLHDELPILLVLGGASGSKQINDLIGQILPELVTSYQVVHQTGRGKKTIDFKHKNYHSYELIEYVPYAAILKASHLVVARAGLSTITELSALAKPSIIIPMPHTHQEDNAKILGITHSAAVLDGIEVTGPNLLKIINTLKFNQKWTDTMSSNISHLMPKDSAAKLAKIVLHYAKR